MLRTASAVMRRTLACSVLGAALGIAAAGCATGCSGSLSAREERTVTLSASGGGSMLVLDNRVGDIRITADPAAVGITAEVTSIGRGTTPEGARKALDEIIVTLDAQPDASGVVRARAEHPSGESGRGYSVRWVVTVPEGFAADVRNGVGDVRIGALAGPVTASVGVGDITIDGSGGDVAATGGTGDIRVTGAGVIRAETKVGDVHVTQRPASGRAPADVHASTGVGDVTVQIATSWQGRVTAGTGVGEVDVASSGATLKAEQSTGKAFAGSLGDATGAQVTAKSNVGDVTVRATGGAGS